MTQLCGVQVIVVTNHEGVPQEFHGAKVIGSWSFPCPWYRKVPLSLALSPRIISEVANFKPDIIHASSPGIMAAIAEEAAAAVTEERSLGKEKEVLPMGERLERNDWCCGCDGDETQRREAEWNRGRTVTKRRRWIMGGYSRKAWMRLTASEEDGSKGRSRAWLERKAAATWSASEQRGKMRRGGDSGWVALAAEEEDDNDRGGAALELR
ncbi:hypothetical protein BHE74_00028290 [Ensete ventricosum]|nr:hypothetical protein GW17_00036218 [Ensete ventricosum]RWW64471.1 hypothetical protein BHE74_00028290 [Ensete ventricosum]